MITERFINTSILFITMKGKQNIKTSSVVIAFIMVVFIVFTSFTLISLNKPIKIECINKPYVVDTPMIRKTYYNCEPIGDVSIKPIKEVECEYKIYIMNYCKDFKSIEKIN